jgi:hypothetical protein
MSEKIPVHAARIPDRDRLLGELLDAGLEAKPVGEVEIMVTAADGAPGTADEVYGMVEQMIMRVGEHFVPIKHDGVIYIRPPAN